MDTEERRLSPWLMFFLFLLLYLLVTPFRDLYGLEARNALFAKEMLGSGPTIIPRIMGRPYPDYPPLYFLLEYIISLPFQKITTFSAVAPSAIAGAGLILLTFYYGKSVSLRVGWLALLILATFPEFWLKASKATIDMLLAFEISLCLFLWFNAAREDLYWKHNLMEFAGFIILCFAFFTKGPIGIVLPCSIWAVYLLFEKGTRAMFLFIIKAAALSLFLISAELWLVWKHGGTKFLHEVMESQVLRRIGHKSTKSIFYYPLYLIKGTSPWCFSIILYPILKNRKDLGKKRKKEGLWELISNDSATRLSVIWFIVVFMIFSVAGTKHGRYLLTLFPPLALLFALLFDNLKDILVVSYRWWNLSLWAIFVTAFIGIWGCYILNPLNYQIHPFWFYIWTIFYLIAGVIIFRTKKDSPSLPVIFTAVVLSFGLSGAQLALEPGLSAVESGRAFVNQAESAVDEDMPVVLYGIDDDRDGVKYALYSSRPSAKLIFANSRAELAELSAPFLLVTKKKKIEELRHYLANKKNCFITQGLIHKKAVLAFKIES